MVLITEVLKLHFILVRFQMRNGQSYTYHIGIEGHDFHFDNQNRDFYFK